MKRMKKQFIKEVIGIKLAGLFSILAGVVMILVDHDATIAVISVPIGLIMLFSKEKFDPEDYKYLEDEES